MSLLSVQNMGKAFRTYSPEWKRFANWLGFSAKAADEQWILKNINFEIQPGEAVGIIGQNGAGKSTLLKIITGTLQPTVGSIQINGRIAAILELGMGFNPELTGRQNAVHSAGLMGFSIEEIEKVLPDIEAFAEIGEYFDEPIRTYSSGMQMRVAFSVTTAFRPEILIVDEALSVGDSYFQHKSFARIRGFQKQGTSLLIVSHDRSAIQNLCDRALLLEKGEVIKDASPEEVFDFYNASIADKEKSTIETTLRDNGKTQTISGSGDARVVDIALHNNLGEITDVVAVGEKVELHIKVKVLVAVKSLVLGYGIRDRLGQVMYGANTWHTEQVITNSGAGTEYLFVIAFPANFGVGSYSVQTALVENDTHISANYEWRDLALIFNVINIDKNHFVGCLWNEPKITISEMV